MCFRFSRVLRFIFSVCLCPRCASNLFFQFAFVQVGQACFSLNYYKNKSFAFQIKLTNIEMPIKTPFFVIFLV